jgi:hypothetical protein
MHPAKADLLAQPDPWAIVIGYGEQQPDLPEPKPQVTPQPKPEP